MVALDKSNYHMRGVILIEKEGDNHPLPWLLADFTHVESLFERSPARENMDADFLFIQNPFVSDVEDLAERLGASDDAVVVYKATTDGTTLKAIAAEHGRDGAVVAELSGLPGQRIVALSETADGPISYLATVIFPARQRVVAGATSVAGGAG